MVLTPRNCALVVWGCAKPCKSHLSNEYCEGVGEGGIFVNMGVKHFYIRSVKKKGVEGGGVV